jgi:hypothetical protein
MRRVSYRILKSGSLEKRAITNTILKKWDSREYARIKQSNWSVASGIYPALHETSKAVLYAAGIIEYLPGKHLENNVNDRPHGAIP